MSHSRREHSTLGWALTIVTLAHLLLSHQLSLAVSATNAGGLILANRSYPSRPFAPVRSDRVGLAIAVDELDEDIFHEIEDSFGVDDTELPPGGAAATSGQSAAIAIKGESSDGQEQPGVFGRLLGATKAAVAPAKEYYDLIARFHTWRVEYNKLQAKLGQGPNGKPRMRDWHDVVRLEYANVDHLLVKEKCEAGGEPEVGEREQQQQENMDFIWKVLRMLIDRLEAELEELERFGPEESQWYSPEIHQRLEEIESTAREATDRAKSIVTRAAAGVAKRELMFILEMLISNKLASYVSHANHYSDDGRITLMGRLEPFVLLMGAVDTPLIVSYLRNVRFRAVFDLASYYLSAVTCSLKRPAAIVYKPEGVREVMVAGGPTADRSKINKSKNK